MFYWVVVEVVVGYVFGVVEVVFVEDYWGF